MDHSFPPSPPQKNTLRCSNFRCARLTNQHECLLDQRCRCWRHQGWDPHRPSPLDETCRIDDLKKSLKIAGNRIGWEEIPKIAWKPMKAIWIVLETVRLYLTGAAHSRWCWCLLRFPFFLTRKARKAGNFNLFSQENCLKMVFLLAARLTWNPKMLLETNSWNLKKALKGKGKSSSKSPCLGSILVFTGCITQTSTPKFQFRCQLRSHYWAEPQSCNSSGHQFMQQQMSRMTF